MAMDKKACGKEKGCLWCEGSFGPASCYDEVRWRGQQSTGINTAHVCRAVRSDGCCLLGNKAALMHLHSVTQPGQPPLL